MQRRQGTGDAGEQGDANTSAMAASRSPSFSCTRAMLTACAHCMVHPGSHVRDALRDMYLLSIPLHL